MLNYNSGFLAANPEFLQAGSFNVPTNTGSPIKTGGGWNSLSDWYQDKDSFWGGKSIFGHVDDKGVKHDGWGGTALGVASSLANSWMAMQQLDLAKEQFAFQKDAFNKQYANQRTLTNARLEDRQRARLGANPTGYQSVGDYMKKNGV